MDRTFSKLMEMVSAGVGAIAGPMLASWKARKLADASRIEAAGRVEVKKVEAAGQAEAQAIFTQAQEMFSSGKTIVKLEDYVNFQNQKRLQNIKDIVEKTADILVEQPVVEEDQVDTDWAARYFGNAQDVSSEELKQLWAKILARETVKSGQTSLRTLGILKDMSANDAQSFERLCRFLLGRHVFHELKEFDFPYHLTMEIESWGLLSANFATILDLEKGGHRFITRQLGVRFFKQEERSKVQLPVYKLSKSGMELSDAIGVETDKNYLNAFLSYAISKGCKLETCEIVEWLDSEHCRATKWKPYP